MARASFQVELSRVRDLTPTVRELLLTHPPGTKVPFKTGQFMMLHVPHGDGIVKRAYSIASSENETAGFSLIFKLVPGGISSEYVKSLQTGETLELSGPFGKCVFAKPPPKQILFLCTGAGLSQHYSMLVSELGAYRSSRFRLLMGVWNEQEIFYKEELDQLAKRYSHFTYEFVLDKPVGTWPGKTGFVTQHVGNIKTDDMHLYLCGNPEMIKGAKQLFIEEKGLAKESVFAEAFNHTPVKPG